MYVYVSLSPVAGVVRLPQPLPRPLPLPLPLRLPRPCPLPLALPLLLPCVRGVGDGVGDGVDDGVGASLISSSDSLSEMHAYNFKSIVLHAQTIKLTPCRGRLKSWVFLQL